MSAGLDPPAFWSVTPREMEIIFAGKQLQFNREHNERAWLAWHVAYLPRPKHPVKLQKLLVRARDPQTVEQMLAIAKQWASASGKVVKREEMN